MEYIYLQKQGINYVFMNSFGVKEMKHKNLK